VGIREKTSIPTLAQFIDNRFEPWAKATFEKSSPKTWRDWYRVGLRAIKAHKSFADLPLNEITSETIAAFAAHRQSQGKQVSTVNSTLRVLRRVLGMAVEWDVLEAAPKVKMLPGERHRERVVTPGKRLDISLLPRNCHPRQDGCCSPPASDDSEGEKCS
jgi:hypothetical protein